jgi:hypothetical protein
MESYIFYTLFICFLLLYELYFKVGKPPHDDIFRNLQIVGFLFTINHKEGKLSKLIIIKGYTLCY